MMCPNDGAEMKLVPAGISKKSGKKYNAFYSCPDCKGTINPESDSQIREVMTSTPRIEPKAPPSTHNESNTRDKLMLMAYAKDLVVAELAQGVLQEGTSEQNTVKKYDVLWARIEK